MNATPDQLTDDPLGYERFALTESAYDLITSLTGIYARMRFGEEKRTEPDTNAVAQWNSRIHQLQDLIHTKDWSDLTFLSQLIRDLSVEYKTSARLEVELSGKTSDAQPNPSPVSAF